MKYIRVILVLLQGLNFLRKWGIDVLKKILISALVFLLSIILVACGAGEEKETEVEVAEFSEPEEIVEVPDIAEEPEQGVAEIVSEAELIGDETVVLIINGEEIRGDHYNLVYYETKNSLIRRDDLTDDLNPVHEETISALIRQTLLAQDANRKGIVVTDSEAEAIYQDTKAQFNSEDEFYDILAQLPYTEAIFREILTKSLLQQYYIDQEFSDISVSSDDIADFYAILQEQMDEAPDLEDIRTEIRNQLLQTEIQMALNDRINQLVTEAEIEELLD